MMKKLLLPVFIFCGFLAKAQISNSWIDYNKTYYKFRLSKDMLTRIPGSVLSAAGLGTVNADQFQLWRNGREVRLFTSVSNAPLTASDYIEFWGQMNDGLPDSGLYRISGTQLSNRYSLETDTCSYFLTVNPAGSNLRYASGTNGSPGSASPDPYFMRTINVYPGTAINRGVANVVGEYIYSAAFDPGENWTSGDIAPCCDYSYEFQQLNVYTAGPSNGLSLRINASGNAPNLRNLRVKIFGNEIINVPMPYFEYQKLEYTGLPLSFLQNTGYAPIYMGTTSTVSTDRMVVSMFGITYPATFNFNNQRNFDFDLAASATGNYLMIDNFDYSGTAPILYDQTSGIRYMGDITAVPGKVRFVLPPSTLPVRKMMLINASNANMVSVPALTSRQFKNYGLPANQGDYLIISNKVLYDDGSGNNYVDQYRQYRASTAGGSFNPRIYDIDELTDQFAFGIKHHPDAIRGFIQYVNSTYTTRPKYVLIIGRGVDYIDNRYFEANPNMEKLNLVTTFGWPSSDNLLVSPHGLVTPIFPVGRLSVVYPYEIKNYLQKIIQYEQNQQSSSPLIADRQWMKNVMHVAGGKNNDESQTFKDYMNVYKAMIEDTLYGGKVETFTKSTAGSVEQASSQRIETLFDEGLSVVSYFGHSSANTFEFNLSNPQIYTNVGKYPFFNVSGCLAGNIFTFDQQRLTGTLSLSEKYVLANQRGSIGFLADTHFGIPPFLDFYNRNFYLQFGARMYGNTVGNQIKAVIDQLGGSTPTVDFYTRIHLEEVTYQGDPALRINSFAKPDYVIEDQLIKINPSVISVADNNFNVKVILQNIGRATQDSFWVSVKRKLPNDSIQTLYNRYIRGVYNQDSLMLTVPINPLVDKGLNKIIVSLDYTNKVSELYETNNTFTKDFYIFEDELRPTSPYNLSIVNQSPVTFVANTANPLGSSRQYNLEVDTTLLFNSPFKKSYNTTGPGGLVEFRPTNISYTDGTVYYWRVSVAPINGAQVIWNSSSFVYLPTSTPGFNQSHYFQHLQSSYSNIDLAGDRKFKYKLTPKSIIIRTGLYPYVGFDRINVNLDFTQLENYGCVYNSLQFYVFDSVTLKPWENYPQPGGGGLYGSGGLCNISATRTNRKFFEFPYYNPGGVPYRKRAMDFIDMVPNGAYVAITNLGNSLNNTSFIDQWKADTLLYGSGNSLYHKLKSIGFTQIDSFTRNQPFIFFFKKGSSSYTPYQEIGPNDTLQLDHSFLLNSLVPSGSIESPAFGPVRKWESLHWSGTSVEPVSTDTVSIEVWGVKNDGITNLMATVSPSTDTTLAFIDARVYPYIKLKMNNKDELKQTPNQLSYWRVNGALAPEGSVAPGLNFVMTDSVSQGQPIEFSLAFKNISQVNFDSLMKVKLVLTDRNNVPHNIDIPKRKILMAGDTMIVKYTIDSRPYAGNNTLFIEFNPDNDQPEQLHYNNVLYKDFFVRGDNFNPLLDVTFDGLHILNNDIVAARPNILIKLKDENTFVALADTSLFSVQIRYPDQTLHDYHFGDSMRFTPANLATGNNTATIELTPTFLEDGEYDLIVSGKDASGNKAGALSYKVTFTVINKPMISNLLNYPNPFTTSTAFVFTITGSEVPQNMRIQILTVTGKIVREITKDELGPIHVGRNITDFKWDGTDMYGQKLANGVYIYRVLTNLNGKSLDKYKAEGDNTDKFFKKGYGKMYLMR